MNQRSTAIAIVAVVLVIAFGIWLLVSGGSSSGTSSDDPAGDVAVGKGRRPPSDLAPADLTGGGAGIDGSELTLTAEVDGEVPGELKDGALSYRWEIFENGNNTWIVTAGVDVGVTASMLATQFDYESSTIDETLPGDVRIDGSTVTVTVDTGDLDDFPSDFQWSLQTSLDGVRTETGSAVATDRMPDGGTVDAG